VVGGVGAGSRLARMSTTPQTAIAVRHAVRSRTGGRQRDNKRCCAAGSECRFLKFLVDWLMHKNSVNFKENYQTVSYLFRFGNLDVA
jgi:hypothetical protein